MVDDSVTYRKIVRDLLARVPGVEVVGVAANGKIALQKIEHLRPDLLTLDLAMPEVDGLEVLRRLKAANSAVGAIMLSAHTDSGAQATVAALGLGAFDFVLKPTGDNPEESVAQLEAHLIPKIEAFAKTRRVERILHDKTPSATSLDKKATHRKSPPLSNDVAQRMVRLTAGSAVTPQVVVLGISTGGPEALTNMMPHLPGDLAAPLLIVQHMPPKFTKSLADDLNNKCALTVAEAEHGQKCEPGLALVAPGGRQMKVRKAGCDVFIDITDDPPEKSCRPSVDYLFRSVAHAYGAAALAVIMTGMGSDGTLGCRLMKRKGSPIIAQDQASCVVYGMPKEPIEEGLADVIAPLDRIADEIVHLVGQGAHACS